MTMPPVLRKFALAVHITSSVGWIGAVLAYLALDVIAATSEDAQLLRAVWIAMGVITSAIIVPLALSSFVTGLMMSLGTPWGLFRHYWVLISLVLTLIAVGVLLMEAQVVSRIAEIGANPATSTAELRALPNTLVHSIGGTILLLVIQVLNVYKPRGLTPYGWRKQQEQRTSRCSDLS